MALHPNPPINRSFLKGIRPGKSYGFNNQLVVYKMLKSGSAFRLRPAVRPWQRQERSEAGSMLSIFYRQTSRFIERVFFIGPFGDMTVP
jgi:hypothetical protein